jgi:hypothetical protein
MTAYQRNQVLIQNLMHACRSYSISIYSYHIIEPIEHQTMTDNDNIIVVDVNKLTQEETRQLVTCVLRQTLLLVERV